MSLSHEELTLVMAFADGETSNEETARAEALLAQSNEARAFKDELARLGAWTRVAEPLAVPAAYATGAHAKFDVADAVMARFDEMVQRGAETTKTKTVPPHAQAPASSILSRAPTAPTAPRLPGVPSSVASPGSLDGGVVSIGAAREKRRRVSVLVLTGLALAAGIALLARTHPNEEEHSTAALTPKVVDTAVDPNARAPSNGANGVNPASSEAMQAAVNAADKTNEPGVEVRVSDSEENGVSVFYLPGTNVASASAVVWFDDTAGDKK